ncbi:MAG: crotonase/enoyl-CoA hydratase family protein [Alphaproteobacteria bacterium]|nr:crotonase/enoyl-CoA hydratase family protein [Alphaproteobacteria bacterium]
MSDQERMTIALEDGVADVRFNRAEKMNALDNAQFNAIVAAIDKLSAMSGLRCIVVSGEGRAFCAGLDLSRFGSNGNDGAPSDRDFQKRTHGLANTGQQAAWGWRMLPVPVIAAVHGVAFGGGFQIMLGADIRFVAPDTRLSVMETKWGLIPDMAGIALMRHLASDDIVRELTYTAREFTGEQAKAYGFATHLSANPHADAMTLAREIAGRSPHAVRAAKRVLNGARDGDAAGVLLSESKEIAALMGTPNQIETFVSAQQKRKPNFQDVA